MSHSKIDRYMSKINSVSYKTSSERFLFNIEKLAKKYETKEPSGLEIDFNSFETCYVPKGMGEDEIDHRLSKMKRIGQAFSFAAISAPVICKEDLGDSKLVKKCKDLNTMFKAEKKLEKPCWTVAVPSPKEVARHSPRREKKMFRKIKEVEIVAPWEHISGLIQQQGLDFHQFSRPKANNPMNDRVGLRDNRELPREDRTGFYGYRENNGPTYPRPFANLLPQQHSRPANWEERSRPRSSPKRNESNNPLRRSESLTWKTAKSPAWVVEDDIFDDTMPYSYQNGTLSRHQSLPTLNEGGTGVHLKHPTQNRNPLFFNEDTSLEEVMGKESSSMGSVKSGEVRSFDEFDDLSLDQIMAQTPQRKVSSPTSVSSAKKVHFNDHLSLDDLMNAGSSGTSSGKRENGANRECDVFNDDLDLDSLMRQIEERKDSPSILKKTTPRNVRKENAPKPPSSTPKTANVRAGRRRSQTEAPTTTQLPVEISSLSRTPKSDNRRSRKSTPVKTPISQDLTPVNTQLSARALRALARTARSDEREQRVLAIGWHGDNSSTSSAPPKTGCKRGRREISRTDPSPIPVTPKKPRGDVKNDVTTPLNVKSMSSAKSTEVKTNVIRLADKATARDVPKTPTTSRRKSAVVATLVSTPKSKSPSALNSTPAAIPSIKKSNLSSSLKNLVPEDTSCHSAPKSSSTRRRSIALLPSAEKELPARILRRRSATVAPSETSIKLSSFKDIRAAMSIAGKTNTPISVPRTRSETSVSRSPSTDRRRSKPYTLLTMTIRSQDAASTSKSTSSNAPKTSPEFKTPDASTITVIREAKNLLKTKSPAASRAKENNQQKEVPRRGRARAMTLATAASTEKRSSSRCSSTSTTKVASSATTSRSQRGNSCLNDVDVALRRNSLPASTFSSTLVQQLSTTTRKRTSNGNTKCAKDSAETRHSRESTPSSCLSAQSTPYMKRIRKKPDMYSPEVAAKPKTNLAVKVQITRRQPSINKNDSKSELEDDAKCQTDKWQADQRRRRSSLGSKFVNDWVNEASKTTQLKVRSRQKERETSNEDERPCTPLSQMSLSSANISPWADKEPRTPIRSHSESQWVEDTRKRMASGDFERVRDSENIAGQARRLQAEIQRKAQNVKAGFSC